MKFKLYPPTIVYLLIIIFGVLGFFYVKILNYPHNLWGIASLIIGFWIMISAHKLFTINKTTVPPEGKIKKLVIGGPYKISRNPMYLGFVLIMIGISVLIGSLISLIAPMLFVIIMNYTWIPFEEKRMEKEFGKEYRKYKQKVRRWI